MTREPAHPFNELNELYDTNYFLSCCGGYREFSESRGELLIPRLQRALEFGAPKGNETILDLGCGRGELAYHLAIWKVQVNPPPLPPPTRGGETKQYTQGSPPPWWGRIKVGGRKFLNDQVNPHPDPLPSRGEGTSDDLPNIPSPPRNGGEGQREGTQKGKFLNNQVIALDLSFEALLLASTLSKKPGNNDKYFQLIRANCLSLPFGPKKFHLIFLTDVIEHLSSSMVKTVLLEIKRILKPGGRLIIHTVPNNLYLNMGYPFLRWLLRIFNGVKLGKEVRTVEERLRHINEQNIYKLRWMLKRSGFDYDIQFEEGCLDSPYFEQFFKTKIGHIVERVAKSRMLRPFFTIGLYACATPK